MLLVADHFIIRQRMCCHINLKDRCANARPLPTLARELKTYWKMESF
jgi:hypothetical protein